MTRFHPIDVRYDGPSTAYRGSASGKAHPNAKPKPKNRVSLKPAQAPQPQGQRTPRGPKAAPPPTRPPRTAAPAKTPRVSPFRIIGLVFRGISGVFRTVKYVYFGIVILTMLFFLLNNPADRFSAVGVPMETINARP